MPSYLKSDIFLDFSNFLLNDETGIKPTSLTLENELLIHVL